MPKLIILGTANAIPDEKHENTHLALSRAGRLVLIDCPDSPLVRLRRAGLDFHQLTDLILTHFHPDHVAGVPSLLIQCWLLGRKQGLKIHGLGHTLDRIEKLMDFYDWTTWPRFYPVEFHRLPEKELTPVLQDPEWRILASPVCHMTPGIGLRIEFPETGKVLAYSGDTHPCETEYSLERGADVLIHEASGVHPVHSSAAQAGEAAAQAGVKELYLIHYPVGDFDPRQLIQQARQTFQGPVRLAEDFMEIEF